MNPVILVVLFHFGSSLFKAKSPRATKEYAFFNVMQKYSAPTISHFSRSKRHGISRFDLIISRYFIFIFKKLLKYYVHDGDDDGDDLHPYGTPIYYGPKRTCPYGKAIKAI
jgi:hypothetical protein